MGKMAAEAVTRHEPVQWQRVERGEEGGRRETRSQLSRRTLNEHYHPAPSSRPSNPVLRFTYILLALTYPLPRYLVAQLAMGSRPSTTVATPRRQLAPSRALWPSIARGPTYHCSRIAEARLAMGCK